MNVRVSTEEQRTDLQECQLKEYVERRGWVLHKLYRDRMPGVSTKRPGLDELLRDCRRRSIDVVVVWKFDRFARSLKTLLSGLELCVRSGSILCRSPKRWTLRSQLEKCCSR
jgi:putative DNA-invertase from lambdoid prophage Rac